MADSILRLRVQSEEYDNKLKRASDGIQRYAQKCREVGGTLEVVEKETLDFVKSLGRMETVSKTAKGSLSEMTKAFTDLKMQYKQLTDAEKQSPFGQELNNSLDQLKSRIIETKNDLKGIEGELNGSKFGQFGNVIDTIGHKLGLTTNATELLTSKMALMYSGIGAGIAIIGKATQEWAAYNAELAKQDQITTVTTGLKDDDVKRMTDTMRALSDTYNVDFRDAINAANTLMSQFGVSGDEATQLIKDGMKGMIHGDGPKLLSMIQQYAPAFQSAGVSASQLVAVIHNSEGGIFTDQNMNAIVMGIKNIRLMTNSTSEALAKLGLDGQDMAKKMSNGSMTVFDALKIVASQLKNVDSNSQAAGEVMQTVFGRQGAMAGTNLAKAIDTLNTNLEDTKKQLGDVGDAYDKLQEANERLNIAIRDAFGYDGWEQMATGIKTTLIGALSDVIEHLAIIEEGFGKIKNFFGGGGGNKGGGIGYEDIEKTQKWINNGKDDDERRRRYDKAIADLQKKLNKIGQEYSVKNADGSTSFKIDDAETQARKRAALEKRMQMLYATKYTPEPEVVKPITPTTPKTTNTSHVKTEEQQNNEAIQKLTQEYLKATDERRAAIRAEIKDLQDRNKEIKRLTDEAQGIKIGDSSLSALTRQLQEFQQQQSQSANGKEWDEYQKKIDATNDKINVLKGNLPKDKQATFTMNVNAEQLEQLRAQIPADETIKVNVEQGKVDLPSVPTDDKTIKVNITADTAEAMKQVRDLTANIEGATVKIEPKVEIQEQDLRTPFQKLQDSIKLELSANNVEVDKNTLKSLTEVVTKYDIQTGTIDMRSVIAQVEELTKSGMTAGESYSKALQDALAKNLDLSSIQQQIGEQINIPDETWQALQDQINAKLKELGIEPIKIDFKTGNIKKESKEMSKEWNAAAQSIQAVGSAMQSIEDPAAKIVGTIGQAIATIALGYAQATKNAADLGPWAWIAFAASGLATMVSSISAIHSSTGYAEGGMIKGNSYSGDNLMAQGPNGQLIGLNAGEIVLNRAQAGVIAGALQGGGQTVRVVGKLSGESIFICAENWAKRTGKGEFVTWR